MAKQSFKKGNKTSKIIDNEIVILTKKTKCILILILVITTLLAFSPSLKNELVDWDDTSYIEDNQVTFEGNDVFYYFGKIAFMGNYHPFTMALYDLQYSLTKLSPSTFHFTNIFIHIINCLLVFWLILKITDEKLIIAFSTAILFAIHPLHVESVTWVSELKDVLYSMFFLLSIISYQFIENKQNIFISKFYFSSLILFIFSCFSKGMAVTLPVALILFEFLKEKKITINQILTKIPFFIISLIFGLIAVKAQTLSSAVKNMDDYSLIEKIIFPIYSSVFYVFKMFLPVKLTIFYPYPKAGELNLFYWLSPIFLSAMLIILYKFRKSQIWAVFGILFYFAMIIPVSQIKPIGETIVSERYFYVSSIGLFFIIGYIVNLIFEKTSKQSRQLILIPLIIFIFACFYITFQRTKDWKNTKTLWLSAIDVNPELDKGYYGVGNVYYVEKNYTEAKKYFVKAISKNEDNIKANNNLGNIYYLNQVYDSAFFYYSRTIEIDYNYAQGHYNLGNIYFIENDLSKALEFYQRAINLEPANQQFLKQYSATFKMLDK